MISIEKKNVRVWEYLNCINVYYDYVISCDKIHFLKNNFIDYKITI